MSPLRYAPLRQTGAVTHVYDSGRRADRDWYLGTEVVYNVWCALRKCGLWTRSAVVCDGCVRSEAVLDRYDGRPNRPYNFRVLVLTKALCRPLRSLMGFKGPCTVI